MQPLETSPSPALVVNPEVRYEEEQNRLLMTLSLPDRERVTYEIEYPEYFLASLSREVEKLREHLVRN
jgi:hypothetical protein